MAGDPGFGKRDRLPVILDVDTGIDDALALLYACASPEIDLLAVTCVAGNVPLEAVVANTLAVLELAGRGDVPVHAGADRPLVKSLTTTEETHGPKGIGYAIRPQANRGPTSHEAATAIVDLAGARPGEVQLVTLGPLTNLSRALTREGRLPSLLRGWTMMGGAFGVPGNTTPTSEWNVHVDPDALEDCIGHWEVWLQPGTTPTARRPVAMGLNVTEQIRFLPRHLVALARRAGCAEFDADALVDAASLMLPSGSVATNPILRFVADALRFYFEFHATNDGFYGAFIHDPFVVAATLDPSLIEIRPLTVDVELGPGLAHGMTVADWRSAWSRAPNFDVAIKADPDAFLDRLVERIGGLAARSATP